MVMGTKVQCTSYLKNYHAMRDLNDANGCWSQYFDDKTLGRTIYSGYQLMPSNECLEYDKEMLKRTILEHEAIFKEQVYELHRLYSIQKEMMDELKKRPCKNLRAHTSNSNSLSSQVQRNLQDNIILDSKDKGLKKRAFDLELPADVYIDSEETEINTESSSVTAIPVNKAQNLADLNEPVKEICFGKDFRSVSSNFGDSKAEDQRIQFPVKSCMPGIFPKSRFYDERTCSNKLYVDDKETNWEWSLINIEAGQSMSSKIPFNHCSYKEALPLLSGNIQPNQKPHEILPLDQNKLDSWFKPDLEFFGKKPNNGHVANPFSSYLFGAESSAHSQILRNSSDNYHSQIGVGIDLTPYQNGFNRTLQNGYTDVFLNHTLLNGFLNGSTSRKINESASVKSFHMQNFPSSSLVRETILKKNDPSDTQNNKKLFGFSISGTIHTKCEEEDNPNCPKLQSNIDLNFDLNSSVFSDEDKVSQIPKEIDLEAPLSTQENQDVDLVREGAQNIILISSSNNISHRNDISYDTLHWFAEVVVSWNSEIPKENQDDSVDSFELMTLELEETKPGNNICHPFTLYIQNEENNRKSNIDSLLFARPKRGQARKRRQRRDFQKDILPGIASLSRKEVSEDIQTIGGLMKAVGKTWEGKNGNCRGRLGRKSKIHISPLPPNPQKSNTSVIGWGWTTRRCRRQRVPAVANATAPLT